MVFMILSRKKQVHNMDVVCFPDVEKALALSKVKTGHHANVFFMFAVWLQETINESRTKVDRRPRGENLMYLYLLLYTFLQEQLLF